LEKVLSERPIKAYQAQGFVFAIDVKSKDEALSYAQRLQAAETHYPTKTPMVQANY
jgi:hypothetical protein